jgi:hypothetical protein
MNKYHKQWSSILFPEKTRVFTKLSTPQRIQDFLDTFPINFAGKGEAIQSPRSVLRTKRAHCMEGAVLAAAALAYHGRAPLLMDFQTSPRDEDHVITVFNDRRHWGAISKTNHPVLRWRDPVYRSARELAMSYFHEYFMWHGGRSDGKKTLRSYSKPFDLRRYPPQKWFGAADLDWLADVLNDIPHFSVVPNGVAALRSASNIERRAMRLSEWRRDGKRN